VTRNQAGGHYQGAAAAGSGTREEDRIRAVYRYYDASPAVQRRRDTANPGTRFIAGSRWKALRSALGVCHLPQGMRMLDVGCGAGEDLARVAAELAWLRPSLHGVDLLPDRIAAARENLPEGIFSVCGGDRLPYPDGHFHVVLAATVFSSILDPQLAQAVAAEMTRVLASNGTILCYDMRYPNPWNPHTRPVGARYLRGLFPGARLRLTAVTLLPPLARRLGKLAPVACAPLSAVSVLRSHYLARIWFPAGEDGTAGPCGGGG
jgi:ubiquinone/menaquinone biosynthesis C-methylase UbiE